MQEAVLITGCSSGIGYATATLLRAKGYLVFATARKYDDVERLKEEGFHALRLDLNDSDSIRSALDQIFTETGGTLYALCNNAGFAQAGALEDVPRHLLREQFETNLIGLMDLTRQVIPAMRRQGYGRIVNISSVLGFVSLPYRGAYIASKYALEGLSDTLRLELHGTGIHVSLIEPGPIESQFRHNVLRRYTDTIDMSRSPHFSRYQKILAHMQSPMPSSRFTLPPDAVAEKILHAISSQKPKARYFVTKATYVLHALKRLLPTAALDWILLRIAQKEYQ